MSKPFELYVDGSYQCERMGIGWLIYEPDGTTTRKDSKTFNKGETEIQSNIIAEALAIREGLRNLPQGADVVIYSDCESVLDILEGKGRARGPITPIIREIEQMADKLGHLELQWVRAHSNSPRNDIVNGLATRAAARPGDTRRSSHHQPKNG